MRPAGNRGVDRNVLLTIAGNAMGSAGAPPGRYRVQGLFIDHEIFIPAEAQHPDIEVHVVPKPLLKFLVHVR